MSDLERRRLERRLGVEEDPNLRRRQQLLKRRTGAETELTAPPIPVKLTGKRAAVLGAAARKLAEDKQVPAWIFESIETLVASLELFSDEVGSNRKTRVFDAPWYDWVRLSMFTFSKAWLKVSADYRNCYNESIERIGTASNRTETKILWKTQSFGRDLGWVNYLDNVIVTYRSNPNAKVWGKCSECGLMSNLRFHPAFNVEIIIAKKASPYTFVTCLSDEPRVCTPCMDALIFGRQEVTAKSPKAQPTKFWREALQEYLEVKLPLPHNETTVPLVITRPSALERSMKAMEF